MSDTIEIYDSTLRDGTQAEGIAFSLKEKLLIARRLDELGVHYIEGGWLPSTAGRGSSCCAIPTAARSPRRRDAS